MKQVFDHFAVLRAAMAGKNKQKQVEGLLLLGLQVCHASRSNLTQPNLVKRSGCVINNGPKIKWRKEVFLWKF